MNNKETNKVDRELFLQAAADAGMTLKELSSYGKLTFGDSPAKIYVAKTAKVTRVDLSGFTIEHEGVLQIPREEAKAANMGKVMAQLDFTQDQDTILAAFDAAITALKEVPAKPKKEPVVKATRNESVEETTVETPTEETTVETTTETAETVEETEPTEVTVTSVDEQILNELDDEPEDDVLAELEASLEPENTTEPDEEEVTDFGAQFETTA